MTSTRCYDRADRLTADTDGGPISNPTYDGRGNITALAGTTITYDSADRAVGMNGGTAVTYTRDASDTVIARTVGGATLWFSGPVTYATDKTTVVESHLTLPGGASVPIPATGARTWTFSTLHGDVVATTDDAGLKQGTTTTYSPYGQVNGALPNTHAGEYDQGWVGGHDRFTEHESTLQLTLMGARVYSPKLARFTQADPIDGGSCNQYDFSCGDPVNVPDLSGEGITDWLGCQAGNFLRSVRMYGGHADDCGSAGMNFFESVATAFVEQRHWVVSLAISTAVVACLASVACGGVAAAGEILLAATLGGAAAHQAVDDLADDPENDIEDPLREALGASIYGAACYAAYGQGCLTGGYLNSDWSVNTSVSDKIGALLAQFTKFVVGGCLGHC